MTGRVHLGATPSPPELVGRAKERRALDELLDAVRDGQSRVLVVRGDAGTGKSALLQHLIHSAVGFQVVHATGVESEMELPFAALHQLCMPLLERLGDLPDPQRAAARTALGMSSGAPPDRLLIGLAVLNLLSLASDDRPVLCVVDDAQWLDRASAQAFTFAARRLVADRVGVVFATRHVRTDLAPFPELVVDGLQDGDAQTLLSSVLHVAVDARVRDRIVAETRGNPLALIEWPRGLTPSEMAGGFGMSARMPMAGQIEETFRSRLAELPRPTQLFLTLAAAEPTGDPVTLWRAASELGLDPTDAAPAITAGLIEIGTRVWFRHPLVRSAAYGAATLDDRLAAHRALALATDPDVDPDRRAWHRALGSPGPDEDIAEALEQSATRAQARGGLAAAAALLDRSVALTGDPARRGNRLLAAATAHLESGSFEVAAGLLAAADAEPLDEVGRLQVDFLRARHASVGGDPRDAPEPLVRAAKRLESLDAGLACDTYIAAMASAVVAGVFSRGVSLEDVAQVASTRPTSAEPTMHDWLTSGLAQATVDGPAAAAPALRRALDAASTGGSEPGTIHWFGYLCAAATILWDADAFHELAEAHVAATREFGSLTMLPWALDSMAHVYVVEGDLDRAAVAIAESRQIYEETGSHILPAVAASHAGLQGDDDAERLIVEQIENTRVAGLGLALKSALWARASFHNGKGEYDKALAAASEATDHPWEWSSQFFLHELVEAAVRCGERSVAEDAVQRLRETVEPSGSDWAIGILRRSQALLAEGADADALYGEAIAALSRTRIRPELARARLLYGEWLRRENRRLDAREHLRVAYEMFAAMGIRSFAERTRRELQATGEKVRKRTVDSFDVLTPQEANIARLAADGRTNPEIGAQLFISPRTVEWHLAKVFAKLGVTSRRALREALPR